MKIANISTIKNNLSRYLRYVVQGETVRITDRNRAIADIVPIESASSGATEYLKGLELSGIIRRGTGKIPKSFFESPLSPQIETGVLSALLDERKKGR